MKRSKLLILTSVCFTLLTTWAGAFGTAFTYQGSLRQGGAPASGLYDFRFTLYDAAGGSNLLGGPLTIPATPVSNGLFVVALDFGSWMFDTYAPWVEVAVQPAGGTNFIPLAPRQALTPTPQAIHASSASMANIANMANTTANASYASSAGFANSAGSVAAGHITGQLVPGQLPATLLTNGASGVSLTGSFAGNGAGLANVDLRTANSIGAIKWMTNFSTSFAAASRLAVGVNPHFVAVADVNGDGNLDLLSADSGGNTLTVLTNNGRGGFVAASTNNLGVAPNWLAAADLNGDGWVDVVSANWTANTLTVLTNNGRGGFVLAANLPITSGARSVVAVDVNGDGWPDLIGTGGNTLTVFTNDGRGGFTASGTPMVGYSPYAVAAADVNKDGWPDLISANFSDNTLTVLTNNGRGGFGPAATNGVGRGPYALAAADVNRDGWVDLISVNAYDSTLTILTNNGRGGFLAAATNGVGSVPTFVMAADVNRDGWADLISVNNGDNTLTVLTNNGRGGFVPACTQGVGSSPWYAAAADVNGDGLVDLISANSGDNALTVLFNTQPLPVAAFLGNGAGLTGLNASNITSGTLSDSQLSSNVALLNASQVFTGANTFRGATVLSNSANTFAGTFAGNGAGLTNLDLSGLSGGTNKIPNLNADLLDGLNAGAFWQAAGNTGTAPGANFVGTADNQPLEFKVNGARVLRLEPNGASPNLIGGFAGNFVGGGVYGATIAGGGFSVLSSGTNYATGNYATVSGGANNHATDQYSTVVGGGGNAATNDYATVAGGAGNVAGGMYSFAAGRRAKAQYAGSFVWADHQNADFSDTSTDQFLIRAAGGVGIGTPSPYSLLTVANAVSGGRGGELSIVNGANHAVGNEAALNFGVDESPYNGDSANAQIKARLMNTSDNRTDLIFSTWSGASFAERVRIQYDGKIGINTATPGGWLDIQTDVGNVQIINDQFAPGLNLTGGPNPGRLRLRDAMEIWPSQDTNRAGWLDVRDKSGSATISLNGDSGEATVKVLTITGGADIAEPFPMTGHDVPLGAVVVIDENNPGQLKLSERAYDTRVAGIVSGANGIHPGLALHQQGVLAGGRNVALSGRVYALADASNGPIKPGDLLTSSDTPGHCMKATDSARAYGTVLGKAMSGLKSGQGLVLVLVNLQ